MSIQLLNIVNWFMGLLGMLATLVLVVSVPATVIAFIVESAKVVAPGQKKYRWSLRFLIAGALSIALLVLILLGWGVLIYVGGMGA